jgi:hypothetical protein
MFSSGVCLFRQVDLELGEIALLGFVKPPHPFETLLFPLNPPIQRSLIAPIGGFTRFFSKPPCSAVSFGYLIGATSSFTRQ